MEHASKCMREFLLTSFSEPRRGESHGFGSSFLPSMFVPGQIRATVQETPPVGGSLKSGISIAHRWHGEGPGDRRTREGQAGRCLGSGEGLQRLLR